MPVHVVGGVPWLTETYHAQASGKFQALEDLQLQVYDAENSILSQTDNTTCTDARTTSRVFVQSLIDKRRRRKKTFASPFDQKKKITGYNGYNS